MKNFERQEKQIVKAIFLQLQRGNLVVLGAETSIANRVFNESRDKYKTTLLEDGSTAFYIPLTDTPE